MNYEPIEELCLLIIREERVEAEGKSLYELI